MLYNVENMSPTIIAREGVIRSILTGNHIIDAIFPLGKGQRQLLIGDNSTGKTSLATTMIIEQKNNNNQNSIYNNGRNRTFSIYISVGNKKSEVAQIGRTLKNSNSSWYTCIVYASSSDSCASQYIAPYMGVNLGEYIRDMGLDSLIIIDDLTKHAISFRQLSLLMKKSPSKEAYPGDIFYLHSRLLERAAQMSRNNLYGSMTIIPIVETQEENFSAYIPTNIISITDGQIYLSKNLFKNGIIPSTDILKSVSRIGAKAQSKILNWSSSEVKNILLAYNNVIESMKLGQQITKTQEIYYQRGVAMMSAWDQKEFEPRNVAIQVIINLLVSSNVICKNQPEASLKVYIETINKKYPWILHIIIKNINQKKITTNLQKLLLAIFYTMLNKLQKI